MPESISRLRRFLLPALFILWPTLIVYFFFHARTRLDTFFSLSLKGLAYLIIALPMTFLSMVSSLTNLGRVLAALLVLMIALLLGRLILNYLRISFASSGEYFSVAVMAGCAALMFMLLGLGAARLLYPIVFWPLIIIPALVGAFTLPWKKAIPARAKLGAWFESNILWKGLLASLGALLFFPALAPPSAYDALVYHLLIPKIYLSEHALVFISDNLYANMPHLVDLLYLLPFSWGGGVSAAVFHYLFGALSLLNIFLIGRRAELSDTTLFLAAAIFLLNPLTIYLLPLPYTDLALVYFASLAFLLLLKSLQTGGRQDVVLAGMALGLGMGVKYNGALAVAAIGVAYLFLAGVYFRLSPRNILSSLTILLFTAVLVFSPWLIKSYLLTGNPCYPFLYQYWGGKELSAFIVQDNWRDMYALGKGGFLGSFFLPLWKLSVGKPGPYLSLNESLSFAFLFLTPFFPLFFKKHPAVSAGFCAALVYYGLWSFSYRQERFLSVVFPFLALASALTFDAIVKEFSVLKKAAFRWLTPIFLGLLLLLYLPGMTLGVDATLPVVFARESQPDFNRKYCEAYEIFTYINRKLPAEARVIFWGENRMFYLERRYHSASVSFQNHSNLLEEIVTAGSPEAYLKKLKAERITHLAINSNRVGFYFGLHGNSAPDAYQRAGLNVLNDFIHSYARLIFQANRVFLFELQDRH